MLMSPLACVNNCKVTLSASCKRVTVVSKNLYGVSSSFFLFFSFFEEFEFIVLYDRANNPVSCSRSSSYRNNTKFSLAETCWNYPQCGRFSFKSSSSSRVILVEFIETRFPCFNYLFFFSFFTTSFINNELRKLISSLRFRCSNQLWSPRLRQCESRSISWTRFFFPRIPQYG